MYLGVSCHNLEEVIVKSPEEITEIMRKAMAKRQVAATKLNKTSSRSHCIFTLTVHIKETTPEGEDLLKVGKLNLVDLAGSESIGRSGAKDKRAREAGNINRSLLTLGRVISALVERTPHIPYRDSKLTRLLQESLGGRAKTCIIATVAPSVQCLDETLSTLDYASRAKSIKNRPEANQKMTKRALIKEYACDIARLREELAAARAKDGVFLPEEQYNSMVTDLDSKKTQLQELESALEARQNELDELTSLFEKTSQTLQSTEAELGETKSKLNSTELELGGTKIKLLDEKTKVKEGRIVINAHKETEFKLQETAKELHNTIESISKDTDMLHGKIERKLTVEKSNFDLAHAHYESTTGVLHNIRSKVETYCSEQEKLLVDLLEKSQQSINSATSEQEELRKGMQAFTLENDERLQSMLSSLRSDSQKLMHDGVDATEQRLVSSGTSFAQEFEASNNKLVEEVQKVLEGHLVEAQAERKAWRKELRDQFASQRASLDQFKSTLQTSIRNVEALLTKQAETYSDIIDKDTASLESFISTEKEAAASDMAVLMESFKNAIQEREAMRSMRIEQAMRASIANQLKLKGGIVNDKSSNVEALLGALEASESWVQTTRDCVAEEEVKETESADKINALMDQTTSTLTTLSENIKVQTKHMVKEFDEQTEAAKSDCAGMRTSIKQILSSVETSTTTLKEKAQDANSEALAKGDTTISILSTLQKAYSESTQSSRSHTKEFASGFQTDVDGLKEVCRKYVHEDLQQDVATGSTPAKKAYTYPKEVACTSPEHSILSRVRGRNPDELDESPIRDSKLKPRSNSIDSPWTGNGLDQENDSRLCNRDRGDEKPGLKRENSVPPPNRNIVFDGGKLVELDLLAVDLKRIIVDQAEPLTKEEIMKLKVVELRRELSARKCPQFGNKSILQQRLLEYIEGHEA